MATEASAPVAQCCLRERVERWLPLPLRLVMQREEVGRRDLLLPPGAEGGSPKIQIPRRPRARSGQAGRPGSCSQARANFAQRWGLVGIVSRHPRALEEI